MCDALQLNWKLNPNVSGNPEGPKISAGLKIAKSAKSASLSLDKSNTLRASSIQKRMETETRKRQPKKRGPKPRPKSAPMSKYRRKTANQRERMRMGEINVAFEKLRDKIPNPVLSGRGKCEKLTKINILHVTINYIRAMENLLTTGNSGVNSYSEMVRNPIRPDEWEDNPKHKKFEACDMSDLTDSSSSSSSAKLIPKKTKSEIRRASKVCKNKNAGGGSVKTFGGFTSPQQRKSSLEPPKAGFQIHTPLSRATSSVSLSSSDSGISTASSSSPPSFEEARSIAASVASISASVVTKMELPDPLLGGGNNGFSAGGDSRVGDGRGGGGLLLRAPNINLSRQLSNGGNNGVLDVPMVTDDSILDLVESLQGDFPDCISFDDDPFDFFPTSSPMTMR